MRGIIPAAACIIGSILFLSEARAEMKTETIEYKASGALCEGVLVYDAAAKGKRPAVLVIHDWMGVSGETKRRAEMLAGLGYVAFCADVYGKDTRPKDRQEAGAAAGKIKKDRELMLARLNAALETLLKNENVDPKRVAAIGYCFGGTCALELARSGAELAGVVSFHGGLGTTVPAKEGQLKAKVLALNGADDPSSSPEVVAAFEKEMREAKADWQSVAYGGAVHAFTNPAAGNDNSKGAAYNEKADKRSWEAMKAFFEELFAEKK
ncbi:MAG: dienelactone hydrolase family protein [Planctomycetes bacterium]|nr:dienelactone hydrolase family protein [Planctomycetota bacterium]